MVGNNGSNLPPGFRFHPTDEELIVYYLRNQATSKPCPVSIIPEVDIYKFDPWQLPEKAEFGENEWYFFTPRDRKYPNGVRPNRAAVSGYWKATGTDKAIYSGSKYVGIKKALVFYQGKPPKGIKTDWIMHEYRLNESRSQPNKPLGSMRGEVYHSYMEVLLGDGIFNSDGENWRKQRKTASFEFASKNLRDFSTVVFREYSLKLSAILSQASSQRKQVDMQELLMRMTLDSICKVGFGVEIGTLDPHLPENKFALAFDTANITVTLRFIDPLWKLKKFLNVGSEAVLDQSIKAIDDFTYSVIWKRKAEIEQVEELPRTDKVKHDLLSRFIELGKEPENNITDKSLRDVVLNFVIAGRDTTATTLSWAIYMIMTHDHVAEKLYHELTALEEERAKEENVSLKSYEPEDPESFNQRAEQFAGLLDYDSLGKLYYLHSVITETLRLYPAVPQDPKGILKDDVLPDGTRVKAGGMVTYVPYSMGRLEYNWGPDAASFKPERWLKDGFFQNASPFKFTAFQAGPRICLGKDSAYLQMKMALAILCRFFKFELVPGHLVKYRMMTILSMANGLKVSVSVRP